MSKVQDSDLGASGMTGHSQHNLPPSFDLVLGMRVITNPLLERTQKVSARTLEWKPWMVRRGYQRRVQKKWDSRYGTQDELLFYTLPGNVLACHPDNAESLSDYLRARSPAPSRGTFLVGSAQTSAFRNA